MRLPWFASVLLLVPALLPAQESPGTKPEVIVLKAARLFDGRGDAVVANGVVIVEGGEIKAAGSGVSIPADMFKRALKTGVKIAFGTDSSVSPHGINAQEFGLMVDLGMKPAAALRSATSGAADLLGQSKTLGTLEPGKAADVIAVPGNPLTDVKVMEKVKFVMKGGEVFKNES